MEGLNQVTLLGRLGADPVSGETGGGTQYARVRLATNSSFTDRETGKKTEYTEWHRVVVFGGLAKVVGDHLRKGSPAAVVGSLRTRKWCGRDGVDRWTTEVMASNVQLLPDARRGGSDEAGGTDGAPEPPEIDDDIPF